MSRTRRDPPRVSPRALRLRRWLLGTYLFLLLCAAVGARGPYYQVTIDGKPFGEEVWGGAWSAHFSEPPSPPRPTTLDALEAPPPVATPATWERPGWFAGLILLLAGGACLFASYDLITDADLQVPTLVCSAGLAVSAGLVFYALWAPQSTLARIVERVEAARVQRELASPAVVTSGAGAAAVASDPAAAIAPSASSLRLPSLRLGWGTGLLFSAAPLLLLVSAYLTFFAERGSSTP